MSSYNMTQLDPKKEFENHIYHRDQFAHYLRWSHVLRRLKRDMHVLDLGCGTGNLLEMIYRNRLAAKLYVGIDIRDAAVAKAQELAGQVPFEARIIKQDLVNMAPPSAPKPHGWDLITCLEVIEHMSKKARCGLQLLRNIKSVMGPTTILLLSTPVFNGSAAENHTIDGEICEYTYKELEDTIKESGLQIRNVWGTFASKSELMPAMEWKPSALDVYEALEDYYDPNILSVLLAPLFPKFSRNCIWELVA